MADDNLSRKSYAAFMAGEQPYIRLYIEFEQPIGIADFVGAFSGLSDQYDKYMRANHPDIAPDADLYIKEVRNGSFEADLLPWLAVSYPAMLNVMSNAVTVEDFVTRWGKRIANYLVPGGRDKTATSSDLKSFVDSLAAIAHDTAGTMRLEAIAFEDGKRKIKAAAKFTTAEAKVAQREIERHQIELGHPRLDVRERVLMTFTQSNIKNVEPGKRSSERVLISDLHDKDLPLIYGGTLIEERLKHEIRDEDENVFKKGFVVDASLETKNGRAVAIRVTELHQIIDIGS
jgi:hypothetical protein